MKRTLVILTALLVAVWVLAATIEMVRRPFYGFGWNLAGVVVETAPGAQLRPGDRLLSINGRRLEDAVDAVELMQARDGRPLRVVVQREGREVELVQPALRHARSAYARRFSESALALLFLAIGVLVALRPTGQPGILFFVFCVAVAIELSGHAEALGGTVGLKLQVPVLWAALLFGAAAFLHFFLIFPHAHPLVRRFPWLSWSIYVPPTAFLLVLTAVFVASDAGLAPELFVRTLERGAVLVALAYFLWAVLTFVDSYRRLEDPLEREKLRWLVWGVVLSIVPVVVLLGLQELLNRELPHTDILLLVLLLFLPVSFGYAILSHRLMDIEIVLNRGLVYTAITVILVIVFIVVENLLAQLSLEVTGQSSFALAMGAAIVMAALIDPVKRRVQLFIDRLFFAYKAKLREGLKDLAEELSFITDLARMEQLLLRRLVDLAHVSRAALFLREEQGDGYVLAEWMGRGGQGGRGPGTDGGPRFDPNDSFVVWLLREGRPISLEALPEADFHQRMEVREVEILRALDAALCLPLRLRGELIGFLFLSRRLNRELFNRDEIDLLHGLAIQAATDLTNARLQTRSRRLEEELASLRQDVVEGLRTLLAGAGAPGAAQRAGSLLRSLEVGVGERPAPSTAD